MENDDVVVLAIDRNTGYIKTCTSCDESDARRFAQYYRKAGYRAKIVTYEELKEMQEKEKKERELKNAKIYFRGRTT